MSAVVTSRDCQGTCLELKAIKRERVHGQRAVVRYHASRSSGEAPWRLNTRQLRRSGIRPVKQRLIDAGWSSLVAREAHNLEVVGSNPAPAIETPVSKSFRPRGFFVRGPRHPAKTRDVTPVFSATYAHAVARAVSLPPTSPVEKSAAGAATGAQISGKSRSNQRHAGSGTFGAFPSLKRFPKSQLDRGVMRAGIG